MANIVEMDARASIEHQARRWLIRMDDDQPLTDVERHTLQEWMSRSPLHRGELVRLAKLWNEANILSELVGDVEARQRERRKLRWACWIKAVLMPSSAVLVSLVLLYLFRSILE